MKQCKACAEIKSADCYYSSKTAKDRLQARCKPCFNLRYISKPHAKSPEQSRNASLKRLYKLSPQQYRAMYLAQLGVCKICNFDNGPKQLCVDHDHATNKVRGLLCTPCNLALGKFQDSEILLLAAVKYLRGYYA